MPSPPSAAPRRPHLPARFGPAAPFPGFRADIEGLRGVAVLLVVLYHVGIPWMPGGFVGVDVFFVLSGYLITGLVVHEVERTGRLDFISFYGRRARRLLPASALVLLVTLLAGALLYSPSELRVLSDAAMAASAYVSNFWFAAQAGDYFAADTRGNPLLHTWSLAVEEQFYLVWPALIAIALRRRSSRRALALGIGAVSVLTLALSLWLTAARPPLAFYASFSRAWEFGAGALAYLVPSAWASRHRIVTACLGWSGIFVVTGAAVRFTDATPFPGSAALLPVAGTAALLVAGTGVPDRSISLLLRNRPLLYIGRISYLWYLWHWPAMVYGAVVLQPLGGYARLLGGAVSLALAAATHHLFENPIRYHPRLLPRPRLSLALALVVTVFGVGIAGGMRAVALAASRSPEQIAFTRAEADRPAMIDQGCLASFLESGLKECVFGEGARAVVLLGDSHAAQWSPALERIARGHGWRLVTMTRVMCPWVGVTLYNGTLRRDYRECDEARRAALARIAEIDPVAVVLANAHSYPSRPGRLPGPQFTAAEWEAGARRTLAHLDSAGVRTFVLLDNPMLEQPTAACLARAAFHARGGSCSSSRAVALDASVLRAESAAGAGLAQVSIVDLTDRFCGPALCDPVRDGMVVYRDRGHLTATFAAQLAPVLEEWMRFGGEAR